ncbi:MAG: nucleotidyltransferase family protein, partial [Thermoplasmata archaeon]
MKAVILAAGEGIRLRPYTSNKPKGMIRVANNPILHYIIDALKGNGIREIIMVVGYAREKIMNYFGNGSAFGVSITYVEQKKQIGTAHALYHARSFLDSEFLVVAGDNIIDKAAVSELISNHGKVSVGLTVSETPSQYGVVSMDGPVIKNIKEKPEKAESNIISTGLYIFPPQIFDIIENMLEQSRFDITST